MKVIKAISAGNKKDNKLISLVLGKKVCKILSWVWLG